MWSRDWLHSQWLWHCSRLILRVLRFSRWRNKVCTNWWVYYQLKGWVYEYESALIWKEMECTVSQKCEIYRIFPNAKQGWKMHLFVCSVNGSWFWVENVLKHMSLDTQLQYVSQKCSLCSVWTTHIANAIAYLTLGGAHAQRGLQ